MRFIGAIFLFSLLAGACASPKPTGPDSAGQVNPVIEQRIEELVAEGRADGFPDIRETRSEAPKLPPKSEIEVSKRLVLQAGRTTEENVEEARAADGSDALGQAAEELLLKIEADRAKAKAEGSLADKADELRQ